ncbi:MAG: F0F1 ATP synthase subunit B [Magnetococcales bacterium]|nr:F0F1 ATP synthase subunit B [Magnetococcales bacterium]NGZ27596.1 F0F1 ATP synthase subunit B [Magnetococcales bacterium]
MIANAYATAAQHAAAGGGVPQFDSSSFASQGFWAVVSFVILVVLLKKYVVPAVTDVLDARSKQIEEDLASAARMREEAQMELQKYRHELKAANENAGRIIEEAKQDANRQRDRMIQQLEDELSTKRAAALAEIEQAKRQAMAEVQAAVVDMTIMATKKLISRTVTKADANRMVTEAIQEMQRT